MINSAHACNSTVIAFSLGMIKDSFHTWKPGSLMSIQTHPKQNHLEIRNDNSILIRLLKACLFSFPFLSLYVFKHPTFEKHQLCHIEGISYHLQVAHIYNIMRFWGVLFGSIKKSYTIYQYFKSTSGGECLHSVVSSGLRYLTTVLKGRLSEHCACQI